MKLVTNARVFALLIVTGATVAVPSYAAGPHKIGPSDPAMVSALAGSEVPTFKLGQLRGGTGVSLLPSEINTSRLFTSTGGAGGAAGLFGNGGAGGVVKSDIISYNHTRIINRFDYYQHIYH